jgi:hypothetical protein
MIRVLSAHAGADTGGIGWALSRAFAGHPTIELRSAVRQSNYIDYPHDLPPSWWDDPRPVGVDVMHLHNTFRTARVLGLDERTPTVIHHHGTFYRQRSGMLNMQARRRHARAVVSTLDLLDFGKDLTWIPHPYDLDALDRLRRLGRDGSVLGRTPSTTLRVGHAPTDRAIKSTAAFLRACERVGVEPVLIERASWADCLRLKSDVDVYFDQVQLGYGCNALEAWGFGIPVIAGAAHSTLERMNDTFGTIPFVVATERTIADALDLMTGQDARDEYVRRGLEHIRRWHDGAETRARLEPIYAELGTL